MSGRGTCTTCPWWAQGEEPYYWREGDIVKSELRPSKMGDCRVGPPKPWFDEENERAGCEFPATGPELWCGKHPDRMCHQ